MHEYITNEYRQNYTCRLGTDYTHIYIVIIDLSKWEFVEGEKGGCGGCIVQFKFIYLTFLPISVRGVYLTVVTSPHLEHNSRSFRSGLPLSKSTVSAIREISKNHSHLSSTQLLEFYPRSAPTKTSSPLNPSFCKNET